MRIFQCELNMTAGKQDYYYYYYYYFVIFVSTTGISGPGGSPHRRDTEASFKERRGFSEYNGYESCQ